MSTPALRVLLVEDSPSDADLLQEHLVEVTFERFAVTHVTSLGDALSQLQAANFDVVLLDLTLPDSSGVETCSRLRDKVPELPVVVLTGVSDQGTAIEAVRHGVQDFLIKGQTDARQIARAIRYAIERQRLEEELRRSEERYRRLADELEQRVEEKTADLRNALSSLEERTGQLRWVAGELTQAEERERRRLAQAMHDHLQQLLVAAKLHTMRLDRATSVDNIKQIASQLNEVLTEAIDATRSLTFELSPPVLYDRTLGLALEWLCEWMESRHGLTVTLSTDPDTDPERQDVRVLLFQATRELLFNVVKHARVSCAHVQLCRLGTLIRIVVSDTGAGFDPAKVQGMKTSANGFGLFSIRERLDLVGGRMEVESTLGLGSRFTLTAPATGA